LKFQGLRILIDENVSPKLVTSLRNQGLHVLDTKEQGWQGKTDDELLEIAHRENCWVLTHDSDFGMLAIHEGKTYHGIIFLRVRNLRPKNVIKACEQLFGSDRDLTSPSLVVVEESRIRIRQASSD